jgi:hypothetical protein
MILTSISGVYMRSVGDLLLKGKVIVLQFDAVFLSPTCILKDARWMEPGSVELSEDDWDWIVETFPMTKKVKFEKKHCGGTTVWELLLDDNQRILLKLRFNV